MHSPFDDLETENRCGLTWSTEANIETLFYMNFVSSLNKVSVESMVFICDSGSAESETIPSLESMTKTHSVTRCGQGSFETFGSTLWEAYQISNYGQNFLQLFVNGTEDPEIDLYDEDLTSLPISH